MNTTVWLKGLLAAIVCGIANTITLMIADPLTFNLTDGSRKLLTVALTSAIESAAMYLKQSPIPEDNTHA